MYRLNVTLMLALAGSPANGAEPTSLTLELTDTATGQPVEDAVVILENGPASAPAQAEIIQKGREFQPHTLVIAQDSKVDFPNQDNTQHHVYSFSPAKTFNIELYAGRPAAPVTFDQTGVVEIGCNIHDHMQAFILVTDREPSGRTDEQGRLTVRIPPSAGEHASDARTGLLVWHPRMTDNTRMTRLAVERPYPGSLSHSLELSPEAAGSGRLDGLQKRFREL